jgi:selenide,water dikinase
MTKTSDDRQSEQLPLLTASVKAQGCAAKISSSALFEMLAGLKLVSPKELICGIENFEDAAVYKISDDLAIVQTVDFFPALVDDPYIFGQIAAANALSDVYAMGAKPILALNVLCFPACDYPPETMQEILRGGASKIAESGAALAGGHSISASEPIYGLSVCGLVHPDKILTNSGGKNGDYLILTKPIGSGVGLLAQKAGLLSKSASDKLLQSLTSLNARALEIASQYDIHGATDITGFGLIGHVLEMARGSKLSASIEAKAVPIYSEVEDACAQGFIPASAYTNRTAYQENVLYDHNQISLALIDLLYDPQTSGGLLLACEENQAHALLADLLKNGLEASVIGRFDGGHPGTISIV